MIGKIRKKKINDLLAIYDVEGELTLQDATSRGYTSEEWKEVERKFLNSLLDWSMTAAENDYENYQVSNDY